MLLTLPDDEKSLALDLLEEKFLSDTREMQIQRSMCPADGGKKSFKGRRGVKKSAVQRKEKEVLLSRNWIINS